MSRHIIMHVSIASAEWSFSPGQVLVVGREIDAAHADAWIAVGHASPYKARPSLDVQAITEAPETAVAVRAVRPRKASK